MSLTIQMLGTGSAFAKHYYNNNALLDSGEGKLLIDCGTTASLALHQMGVPLPEIDAILITHIHADHVGGLEEFGFQMNILHRRKPKLYIAEPLIHPLWEHTLKGGMAQQGMIEKLEDVFEVNILIPGKAATLVSGIEVELIPTRHIPGKSSYSLFINGRLFYSADMIFDSDLLHHLVYERGCQSILHEVQLQGAGEVHTTLDELLSLSTPLQERIHLMHYSDDMEQFREKAGVMSFLEQQRKYDLAELERAKQ
ncbi:MBL fold metallo-hydrolase [Paenibacillus brasilensis]|uniref:Ribonuclease BN (tRNA processing enzyme) n=1 Tax=Paenibacillus brasilensis TaxID=128574 RepID=A0ABU0L1I0_9BACL|nr:MBL fold metallo-hydrolase [Paenibacillus brasilensis]MDQ0495538.1 ribonuclease BN (tRNA processing enzyme) [Paenibacillus brasilensis]